jgi:hypothetical protein
MPILVGKGFQLPMLTKSGGRAKIFLFTAASPSKVEFSAWPDSQRS